MYPATPSISPVLWLLDPPNTIIPHFHSVLLLYRVCPISIPLILQAPPTLPSPGPTNAFSSVFLPLSLYLLPEPTFQLINCVLCPTPSNLRVPDFRHLSFSLTSMLTLDLWSTMLFLSFTHMCFTRLMPTFLPNSLNFPMHIFPPTHMCLLPMLHLLHSHCLPALIHDHPRSTSALGILLSPQHACILSCTEPLPPFAHGFTMFPFVSMTLWNPYLPRTQYLYP